MESFIGSAADPHCVFGGGITRALTADVGVLKAFAERGVRFATIGGVSSGAIAPLFAAAGYSVAALEKLVLDTDFSQLVERNPWFNIISLLWCVLNRRRYRRTLPTRGLCASRALGAFIDSRIKQWPRGYWTAAFSKTGEQIIFTDCGAFSRTHDNIISCIDENPPSPGLAIRATSALPGFFEPVEYTTSHGKTYQLFDAIASWDGICPVGMVQAFFGVPTSSVIAYDVGKYSKPNRLLGQGFACVITPDPPFPWHAFNVSRDQRRMGMEAGFSAANAAFAVSNPDSVALMRQ